MEKRTQQKSDAEKLAEIVADAGGKVVGRTRLQKLGYILEVAGFGGGFSFEYRYYGPYSETLAIASMYAGATGLLREEEHPANWGGTYSIFETDKRSVTRENSARVQLAKEAVKADPVELELAATALFLVREGHKEPWKETAIRKPDKAKGRMEKAKKLYQRIREIAPRKFPNITM